MYTYKSTIIIYKNMDNAFIHIFHFFIFFKISVCELKSK